MGAGRRGGHGLIRAGRAGHGRPGGGRGRLDVGERAADGEQHRAQRDVRPHQYRCLGGGRPVRCGGPDAATPAAYHWNGSAWSLTATPSLGVNAGLNEVSASSASDAWAVGFTLPSGYRVRQPLYEHWNGSAWSVVSGPGLGLNGVADLSPANAWAVGIRGTVEHWDGTAWSSVTGPSPNPSSPAGANLNAITAVSASNIWAVGSFYNTSFTISAFALHYNGSSWTVTILPQPAVTGPSSPILHGVTAVASNNIWAVGENEEVPG